MNAGFKTTEFWLTILSNIVSIVGSLAGVIPPDVAAIIIAVANGLYGILRSIVKKGATSNVTTVTTAPSTLMGAVVAGAETTVATSVTKPSA